MGNDVAIVGGIALFFIVLGIILPLVRSDLGLEDSTSTNPSGLQSGVSGAGSTSTLSAWEIIKSVGSMFVWSFGSLPVWIDAVLVVPRLMLAFIIVRNIWIGGGA